MNTRETTIQPRKPGRTRRPVLTEDAEIVAEKLQAAPGNPADPDSGWHLIAFGDRSRLGVISQTSYRIRNGKIQAFASAGEGGGPTRDSVDGGHFETWVSTDTAVPNRRAEVELFARWVTR